MLSVVVASRTTIAGLPSDHVSATDTSVTPPPSFAPENHGILHKT